jgi:hypothetical protein
MIVSSTAGFTTDMPDQMIETFPSAGTFEALRRAALSRRRKYYFPSFPVPRIYFPVRTKKFPVRGHGNSSANN